MSKVGSKHQQIQVDVITKGLHHPWAIALLPGDQYLVTERDHGRLRLGSTDGSLSGPLAGVNPVYRFHADESSQSGLFDVKADPDFQSNRLLYLSYAKPTDAGAALAIDRAQLDVDGSPRLTGVSTIFELNRENQDSSSLHFGGRMAFHPVDGSLFLTVGDRRNMNRAQNLLDQAGKILRMNRDGSPASDNPFSGRSDADPYVWSYGHRNSQGLCFHPETFDLWENEHGPKGGDELNFVTAGGNYGWPLTCGGDDYSGARIGAGRELEGTMAAFHYFEETVAPSGLAFVSGAEFPDWQGQLLHGGLMTEGLVRQKLGASGVLEQEFIDLGRRIRDVQLAVDGSIWLVTDHADGEVMRLSRP